MGPLTSTASPSRAFAAERTRPAGTIPMPDVEMNIPSAFPRSTTFVSPHAMITPVSSHTVLREERIRIRSCLSRPSSRMRDTERYFGCAPIMARSLMVPQAESLPMSPPRNSRGHTTNESLVKASVPPCTVRSAASSRMPI